MLKVVINMLIHYPHVLYELDSWHYINSRLTTTEHVCNLLYNLRQLRPVVQSLTVEAAKTPVQALVTCRLLLLYHLPVRDVHAGVCVCQSKSSPFCSASRPSNISLQSDNTRTKMFRRFSFHPVELTAIHRANIVMPDVKIRLMSPDIGRRTLTPTSFCVLSKTGLLCRDYERVPLQFGL